MGSSILIYKVIRRILQLKWIFFFMLFRSKFLLFVQVSEEPFDTHTLAVQEGLQTPGVRIFFLARYYYVFIYLFVLL